MAESAYAGHVSCSGNKESAFYTIAQDSHVIAGSLTLVCHTIAHGRLSRSGNNAGTPCHQLEDLDFSFTLA